MSSLTVTGWPLVGGKSGPVMVSTRSGYQDDKLLNFEFENNPPSNPDGNLNEDIGSLYDKRLKLFSSPLEIIYDQVKEVEAFTSCFTSVETRLYKSEISKR